jgi:hypothetical protein
MSYLLEANRRNRDGLKILENRAPTLTDGATAQQFPRHPRNEPQTAVCDNGKSEAEVSRSL